MKTNRQLHEEAAGMNLEDSFFTISGIDPDAIPASEMSSKLDSITKEESEAWLDKDNEHRAMVRFFNGEEPGFSTGICEFLTCGYGKLSHLGYWEYPLPAPSEQWFKPKNRTHDLKVKIGGMKFKVRVVDVKSGEIIKRNYLHIHNDDLQPGRFGSLHEAIKQAALSGRLFVTKAVGESVTEHTQRTYIEVVDETYVPTGELSYDFVQYSKKHL